MTKILFHDFYNIKNNNLTLNPYPALTYFSTINVFSQHSFQPEFKFCKPNLRRSLIMQSQLESLLLVDTDFIDDKKINYICLTHVWQKLGGWCILTMTTKYKHTNGLTPSAANRPAFPSAKR